ncbi:PAQR family membrane homeostasis protein TrhA [Solimonas marina]|uniref:Hemolysin III family protein n=1 Tax=Solimonas marina TaxID=2714601 RepID=A0A969W665_9GAMM|nr:hemolysin III family protein [Solimonas marina]NKF21302.1 hemolysin III family protein [Solimonas marina]
MAAPHHTAPHQSHRLGPVEIPESLYSLGEEIAHAVTHGVGVLLAIVGLTVLVARAALYGNEWHIIACSVFGATLVLMYTASTLYHSIPDALPRAKQVLRVLDHSMIYFLIAGTYTPFTLVTLHGAWGWSLFAFTWGLTAIGVIFKIFATGRYEKLSLFIYLAMGWCAIVAIKPILKHLDTGGIILTAAGGLAYSGGVVFYVWERLRYHHAIWHLFVLTGSVLQYFAVLLYVVPGPNG